MANGLGPLAALVGIWEGEKADDRNQIETNRYREQMRFEPTGLVENHEQQLYGLRYATTAWRIGESAPFHEELGYWLWDAQAGLVLRCFMVPRGVTVIAGGQAAPDASSFELRAERGSPTRGICSNPFLDREFRSVRYELKFEIRGANTIHYWEDSVIEIPGREEPFHHTDENTLERAS